MKLHSGRHLPGHTLIELLVVLAVVACLCVAFGFGAARPGDQTEAVRARLVTALALRFARDQAVSAQVRARLFFPVNGPHEGHLVVAVAGSSMAGPFSPVPPAIRLPRGIVVAPSGYHGSFLDGPESMDDGASPSPMAWFVEFGPDGRPSSNRYEIALLAASGVADEAEVRRIRIRGDGIPILP